jgi:F420H(2)-dependent quinone reductase
MKRNPFNTIFRPFMTVNMFLYRLTGGIFGGRIRGLQVLLLTTTGRKTGKPRTTPLGYFIHDGRYVITASNSGMDTHPAWFLNLKNNPQVALQIGARRLTATAEPADPALREQLWAELVKRSPSYKAYQKHTTRTIPMVLLRPVEAS